MKVNKFYRTSQHGGVGSTVMFWCINGAGYTSNIDEAHVYDLEEAQKQINSGYFCNNEHPLSVAHVNELSEWRVDHQYLSTGNKSKNNEYVIVKRGEYDGNDVPFIAGIGSTTNYADAEIFTMQQAENLSSRLSYSVDIYPREMTDEIARRTFQFKNINRRKMITNAGVVGCKKKRESKASGKTRWNCPSCGKISWQWNPYDFDGCKDWDCDEFNIHNQ